MTKDEALTRALEALKNSQDYKQGRASAVEAVEDIEEALATDYRAVKTYHEGKPVYVSQPEQEPVAWMCQPFGDDECEFSEHQECEKCTPLYTTPPKEKNT